MKIASIKKTSLLDYPGKVATIIGTQGCNMRCPWCHNAYLIPYDFGKNSTIIDEMDFFCFLDQRRNLLEGVVITGGEPTIQSDLPDFCEKVKEMGFAVKLDTNGTVPNMLDLLIKKDLVDYLAMDIKTDIDQYPRLFRETIKNDVIVESAMLVQSSGIPYEFRTTCVDPYVSINNIDKIGFMANKAKKHYLQKCNEVRSSVDHKAYRGVSEIDIIPLKNRLQKYVPDCEIR